MLTSRPGSDGLAPLADLVADGSLLQEATITRSAKHATDSFTARIGPRVRRVQHDHRRITLRG